MRTIYIIGIDHDPDGCYITDALEKPEHTIAGPFHSQQNAIDHAIDAELRVHSRWNEILPGVQVLPCPTLPSPLQELAAQHAELERVV
jgi:hypothetical protein